MAGLRILQVDGGAMLACGLVLCLLNSLILGAVSLLLGIISISIDAFCFDKEKEARGA